MIHNLKLDKTYTGRQTLGNETIVEVFLYDNIVNKNEEVKLEEEDIEIDDVEGMKEIKTEKTFENTAEHDYCFDRSDTSLLLIEHSYSSIDGNKIISKVEQAVEQDEDNILIHGLGDSYLDSQNSIVTNNKASKNIISLTLNQLIQLSRKDTNKKIIILGRRNEKMLPETKVLTVLDFKVNLPKNKFKNMGEALPYLFKRLPLYSDLANNDVYKRLYPFTMSSLKDFWNIGKRRSAEVCFFIILNDRKNFLVTCKS